MATKVGRVAMYEKSLFLVFLIYYSHFPSVNDLYKDHIGFIYYFNLLPLSYNVSACKDQNQNWCVIGYVNVQKMSFHIFWPF